MDLLITPWLIDVIDAPLQQQLQTYAPLIKPGGYWLNHGSLAFDCDDVTQRLDAADVKDMTESNGFEVLHASHDLIPYLQNPNERHQRQELTFNQLSRRTTQPMAQASLSNNHAPVWRTDLSQAVTLSEEFQLQITSTRVHRFIMSLINGEWSIKDIAGVLEEQRLMSAKEGSAAVANLLRIMHNEKLAQLRQH